MLKLLNETLIIPSKKDFIPFDSEFVRDALQAGFSFTNVDGRAVPTFQGLYNICSGHFPNQDDISLYCDFKNLNAFFLARLKVDVNLQVNTISSRYEKVQAAKDEAPASVDFTNGKILFRQDPIFKIVASNLVTLLYFQRKSWWQRSMLKDFLLALHLYLLDHELAHVFFSPTREERDLVKQTFVTKHPEYAKVDDKTFDFISNVLEDMYIEDKYKSSVYPNDPIIHTVYDIGRYLMGRR